MPLKRICDLSILLCLILLFPKHALALSCLPWDVADSYILAQKSEKPYLVVRGRLTFDEEQLPQHMGAPKKRSTQEIVVQGQLVGFALSRNGFDTAFANRVDLAVRCFGPWCPNATSGTEYLAFITGNTHRFVLHLDPCAPMGFKEPTNAQIDTVITCLRSGRCRPAAR